MSSAGSGASVKFIASIAIGLVVIGFIVGIGMIINQTNIDNLQAQDLGLEGNKSRDALISNLNAGYQLIALTPYLLAAMAVITVIFGVLYVTGRVA